MTQTSDSSPIGLFKRALPNVACGMFMGTADVVPGVSGGTVALLMGIYHRLITAISRFDRKLLQTLMKRQWRQAWIHIDGFFLITLATGIGLGFVATIKTVSRLLDNADSRPYVWAIFLGMVVASAWIVAKRIERKNSRLMPIWIAGFAGMLISAYIALIPAQQMGNPSPGFIALCGFLAISAMILPGISGALILLLLGIYPYLVDVAKEILQFQNLSANLTTSLIFASGCLVGLFSFSKILRFLLDHRPAPTLAFLVGLMIGSIPKLWPLQQDITPEETDFRHKIFQPEWPQSFDQTLVLLALTVGFAFVVTLLLEWWVGRRKAVGACLDKL